MEFYFSLITILSPSLSLSFCHSRAGVCRFRLKCDFVLFHSFPATKQSWRRKNTRYMQKMWLDVYAKSALREIIFFRSQPFARNHWKIGLSFEGGCAVWCIFYHNSLPFFLFFHSEMGKWKSRVIYLNYLKSHLNKI